MLLGFAKFRDGGERRLSAPTQFCAGQASNALEPRLHKGAVYVCTRRRRLERDSLLCHYEERSPVDRAIHIAWNQRRQTADMLLRRVQSHACDSLRRWPARGDRRGRPSAIRSRRRGRARSVHVRAGGACRLGLLPSRRMLMGIAAQGSDPSSIVRDVADSDRWAELGGIAAELAHRQPPYDGNGGHVHCSIPR
jgi:hypothetical protein